jgi:hypothetical protein
VVPEEPQQAVHTPDFSHPQKRIATNDKTVIIKFFREVILVCLCFESVNLIVTPLSRVIVFIMELTRIVVPEK